MIPLAILTSLSIRQTVFLAYEVEEVEEDGELMLRCMHQGDGGTAQNEVPAPSDRRPPKSKLEKQHSAWKRYCLPVGYQLKGKRRHGWHSVSKQKLRNLGNSSCYN